MKTVACKICGFLLFSVALPASALAACDETIGNILRRQLEPVVTSIDCAVVKRVGIDKERHSLGKICYESSGPKAHVRVGVHLKCKSGGVIPASVSENVNVEFDINGQDCSIENMNVKPSGELGKALANSFNANERGRQAVEQGLAQVCKT